MALSRETVQTVKERADIIQVVGEKVSLLRAGADFKALCPFHSEKTPSFVVSSTRRMYKCFGCDAGGSVIDFVMAYERMSFPEAVTALAERFGIPIGNSERPARTDRIPEALQAAQAFYHGLLLHDSSGQAARDYLLQRHFKEADWLAFGLGYAPPGWQGLTDHAASRGIALKDLEGAGLAKSGQHGRPYDFLRNRVVFPILDTQGRCIAFGGRAIVPDDTPKYLNTPESRVYHKQQVLFGLNSGAEALRKSRRAILCEGYLDVIRLHGGGFKDAVATCGTALTGPHLRLLERYVDRAVLVFDGDEAGIKAALRSAPLFLDSSLEARVITLPDGLDPDDFVQQRGAEAFERLLETAVPILEYTVVRTLRQFGSTVEGKSRALQALVPVLSGIRQMPVRDMTIRYVADLIEVPAETVVKALKPRTPSDAPRPQDSGISTSSTPEGRHYRRMLACLLRERKLLPLARELVAPDEFPQGRLRTVFDKLLRLEDQEFVQLDTDELMWMFPEEEADIRALLLEDPLHMSAVQDHGAVLRESVIRIKLERKRQLMQQWRKVLGTPEEDMASKRVMRATKEIESLRAGFAAEADSHPVTAES